MRCSPGQTAAPKPVIPNRSNRKQPFSFNRNPTEWETIPPSAQLVSPRRSRSLLFPKVTDPEDPLLRPERHIPNSIALILILAAMSMLSRSAAKLSIPLMTQ
jgi:hypothetical protein